MPSGGHARSGPPPDPNALRRERDKADWVTLPAEGRSGPPPAWPLSAPTARERHFWTVMWAKPQAVMWERNGQEHEVAIYVRRLVAAEKRNAAVTLVTQVRQYADSLGLTIPGLRCNRWRIGTPASSTPKSDEPVVPFRPRVVADAVEGTG